MDTENHWDQHQLLGMLKIVRQNRNNLAAAQFRSCPADKFWQQLKTVYPNVTCGELSDCDRFVSLTNECYTIADSNRSRMDKLRLKLDLIDTEIARAEFDVDYCKRRMESLSTNDAVGMLTKKAKYEKRNVVDEFTLLISQMENDKSSQFNPLFTFDSYIASFEIYVFSQ